MSMIGLFIADIARPRFSKATICLGQNIVGSFIWFEMAATQWSRTFIS
jgi:hypothetical protein